MAFDVSALIPAQYRQINVVPYTTYFPHEYEQQGDGKCILQFVIKEPRATTSILNVIIMA